MSLSIRCLWKITCLSSHSIEGLKHSVRHIIIWQPFWTPSWLSKIAKCQAILKDGFTLIIHCWCFIIFSVKNYRNMLEISMISFKFAPKWPLTSKCDMLWGSIYGRFALLMSKVYFIGLFYKRIWINSCLGVMNSIAIFSFWTHLTFYLILRLRRISRPGIHPYGFWHTSRNTISMDTTFYSILPSEELFSWNWLPTM